MLSALAQGNIKSRFLLVIDAQSHPGHDLFLVLVQGIGGSTRHPVHMLCFEHSCKYYKFTLKNLKNVIFHDCKSDPAGWNGSEPIRSLTSKLKDTAKGRIVLVVDSLSSMFFTVGYGPALRELAILRKRIRCSDILASSIVCLVHSDAILDAPSVIRQLKHLATTCVDLCLQQNLALIFHRRKQNLRERKEHYTLSDGKISVYKASTKVTKYHVHKHPKNPQDVATFHVKLGS